MFHFVFISYTNIIGKGPYPQPITDLQLPKQAFDIMQW